MSDADLIKKWQRELRWHRRADSLPTPIRRAVASLYRQRPTARLDRRGHQERARLAEQILVRCAGTVQRGPFAGMVFPFATWDAPAKCIGSYECELHDEVERIFEREYWAVINVGCAEGYYAIGLARAMPGALMYAYDTDPEAIAKCKQLAEANTVPPDRLKFGGEVTHQVLDELCRPNSLVIVDIEGGEAALLDPASAPHLAQVDLLIELHHNVVPNIEQVLRQRFARTHSIRSVDSEPRIDASRYPELDGLTPHEQALAMFERPIVMRWLILESTR